MNEKLKTMVILSPGFPANSNDSTCLPSQQNFIRSVNKQFPNLKLIVLALQYPFTTDQYDWLGNEVIPFNGLKYGKIGRFFLWLKVYKQLLSLYKKFDLIGVLSFWCT